MSAPAGSDSDGTASGSIRDTLEHVRMSLPQQRRLDLLRERHHEIRVNSGPDGTMEATVEIGGGERHIFRHEPDALLDKLEEVIETDPDG